MLSYDLLEVYRSGLEIQAAGERWIGKDQRLALRVVRVGLRERILVADVRVLDAMQQHVHAADAKHRRVEVEAVERPR